MSIFGHQLEEICEVIKLNSRGKQLEIQGVLKIWPIGKIYTITCLGFFWFWFFF